MLSFLHIECVDSIVILATNSLLSFLHKECVDSIVILAWENRHEEITHSDS